MNFKFYITIALRSAILILALVLQQLNSFAQSNKDKINIGLVYPLSSNWKDAPNDTNKFSLNLIAGVSAAERGLTLGGISNIVRHNTTGLQIAGFSNHVGETANGTMIAGFLNTYGTGKNFAIAGFGNLAKTGSGTQIAGFINVGGNVSAVQVAGFTNIANDVKGSQISGFMNTAKKVKGVQIAGFVNIADSADYQIGIINISKNGEKSLGVMIDENQTTLITFRSGGKLIYGILGVGYNFDNKNQKYAWQAGLGVHLINAGIFRLNTELTQNGLESFKRGTYLRPAIALLPSIRLANHIDIFAGPSFNYVTTNTTEGRNMHDKYTSSWGGNNGSDFHGFYFGYSAGVQVRL
jgi:hypothetical protein